MEEHNAFAGQGSVLLDIGGDIGALIVSMPAAMEGIEIEIRPVGADHADKVDHSHDDHSHDDHSHDDHSHDDHSHDDHSHDHVDGHHHHPHVAVVGRPTARGLAYTAVFPELAEGTYELYEKLGGPVRLQATVTGGRVEDVSWPI